MKRIDEPIKPHGLRAQSSSSESEPVHKVGPEKALAILKSMDKSRLIEWAMEVLTADPSLCGTLPGARPLAGAALGRTVARVRRQIDETMSEGGWQDRWGHGGFIPDYSPIREQLENLLSAGHVEAVMELGEEIFERGVSVMEQTDDQGETRKELSGCMDVVLDALGKTGQSAAVHMIWYWDKLLNDTYLILDGLAPPVDHDEMTPADWREVAEEFGDRLSTCPRNTSVDDGGYSGFHRTTLLDYALEALSEAGEGEQATALMIAELPYCHNYVELVEHLMASKAHDQAEHWARQGFRETIARWPGVAWKLVDHLRDIARKRKDWTLAAALQVDRFLEIPNVENYRLAAEESRSAGCWEQVRHGLLRFLETGASPSSASGWPLPDTGLKSPKPGFRPAFPNHNELIAIALHEKRAEDALLWFRKASNGKAFNGDRHADAVAQAVKGTHPDVSLEVWQRKAESLIARVQANAYLEATRYLSRMERLLGSLGRSDEYHRYVSALRVKHKAKRLLMEALDDLEHRKK